MQWLATTLVSRYRVVHKRVGGGSLYQGRFKSFLIENDAHLLTKCRYVERNALRAGLVRKRAGNWRWSRLWRWKFGDGELRGVLIAWPVRGIEAGNRDRPRNGLRTVNTPLSETELEGLRTCANRCSPFGKDRWHQRVIQAYGLESTVRSPGRPRTGMSTTARGGLHYSYVTHIIPA